MSKSSKPKTDKPIEPIEPVDGKKWLKELDPPREVEVQKTVPDDRLAPAIGATLEESFALAVQHRKPKDWVSVNHLIVSHYKTGDLSRDQIRKLRKELHEIAKAGKVRVSGSYTGLGRPFYSRDAENNIDPVTKYTGLESINIMVCKPQ